MAWNEISVTSWREFTDALEEVLDAYKGHIPPVYVFRGQPDASWLLEPSLLRELRSVGDPGAARKIEELLETEFSAQASLFPETQVVWLALLAAGRTELWAYMQHHGCPTRLLDWTASAYVAAYFAISQFPDRDGAVRCRSGRRRPARAAAQPRDQRCHRRSPHRSLLPRKGCVHLATPSAPKGRRSAGAFQCQHEDSVRPRRSHP